MPGDDSSGCQPSGLCPCAFHAGQRVVNVQKAIGDTRIEGVTLRGGSQSAGTFAGGVFVEHSALRVARSVIETNALTTTTSTTYGGGLGARWSSVTLRDVVVRGNSSLAGGSNSRAYGGGLSVISSKVEARNVLVARNRLEALTADTQIPYGHGIHVASLGTSLLDPTALFENITVVANTNAWTGASGGDRGEGLRREHGNVTIRNAIFWDHLTADVTGTVTLRYSNTEDGVDVGNNGNISANPLFLDAASNDFRLDGSVILLR